MNTLERRARCRPKASLRQYLVCLAVALVGLVATRDVRAAPLGAPGLLVFELVHELRHDASAVALTNELRQRVNDSVEFALMSDNPSLVQTARAVGCEAKSLSPLALTETSDRDLSRTCQARIGKRLGASSYLWGYLFERRGELFVKLHLWQQGQDERAKVLPYREGSRALAADRLYRHLVKQDGVGDLRVVGEAGLAGGELYVQGETKPLARFEAGGVEVTLPRGPVALEVRAAGKVLALGRGEVGAGEARELRLEPVAEPAPPPVVRFDPTEGFRAPPTPPPAEPAGSWQRTAGWVGLGVGAATLGFGVFANLRTASLNKDFRSDGELAAYRKGMASDQDACSAAEQNLSGRPGAATPAQVRDHCSSFDTWSTVRTVSYVGGGLLVVGGAALVLLAPSSPEGSAKSSGVGTRWTAAPTLGPSFAGASLRASW